MEVNKKAEPAPRYCPICETEWQSNATCCSGCGAKKVSRSKTQSGAKNGRDIDEYVEGKTLVSDHCTVRVFRPILTAEERERRMKAINDAAVDVMREVWRAERRKEKQNEKTE